MVLLTMDGKKNILSPRLDEKLLDEERDFIEDVIISAINKANAETDKQVEQKMSSVTGGMMPNIPGF